jgi:protein TonB
MLKRLLAGFVFCTVSLDAAAQEPARVEKGYIVNAQWIQRPTPEQAYDAYPPFALERDIAGKATLDCLVEADGALTCQIESETPPDRSFGGASLGLARYYRMAPTLADGMATAGLRARLNMSYAPPPPPPPPAKGIDLLAPR